MNPNRILLTAGLALAAICLGILLSSCAAVPVTASYTGAAAGHNFTAAYSTTNGLAVAVSAK